MHVISSPGGGEERARVVMEAEEMDNGLPLPSKEHFVRLYVRWEAPDKRLVSDFAEYVRKHRPYRAVTRRGKSPSRKYMADLKALGAYRLMKTLTAERALEYTKRFLPHGLYAKIPDWYEAKGRAQDVLRTYFGPI